MRNGSSPNVSSTRPQRRSRVMHSTGEKVQWMPVADTSTAVTRATCSTSSGSQERGHAELGREDRRARARRSGRGCSPRPTSSGMPQPGLLGELARPRAPARARRAGSSRRACRSDDVVEVVARVELQHLPDLLRQRHPAEQVGDPLGDGQGVIQVARTIGHCSFLRVGTESSGAIGRAPLMGAGLFGHERGRMAESASRFRRGHRLATRQKLAANCVRAHPLGAVAKTSPVLRSSSLLERLRSFGRRSSATAPEQARCHVEGLQCHDRVGG